MKLQTLRRTGVAAAAISLSLGLAACSSEDDSDSASDGSSSSAAESPSETMSSPSEEETMAAEGAAAQTFGDACSAVPADGPGSFDGMVQDPVATAASNNPLLETLVTAVGAVDGLGDTLNSAEALTVFAPTNDAFAAIPEKQLQALLKDQKKLGAILSHHVVAGQLDPEAVVGKQDTLNKDTITVEGDTSGMTVDGATVLCGNIPTANATVYVIDQVLMPQG
ncbi:fasciclin domain-containing protein [Nocardioides sp. zg-579]|uniref:Fasciclin domain-containing protein n=1 Tax=Nocardioides marmotae TaxID=2663857 RepID=A0A6I3JF05_9ACTN|nr:fasciclin domain-containing protein [Nocardioides marmotae]MCR6033040.1 fasciclin domain-containing protein [Gordonia jinghuaiqii]MTB96692.1 fasciclin domain-containing protein [Nocardioides marmotae]QKE03093.1 fasciclin domain-containing protein [Nocardioides marmotae]